MKTDGDAINHAMLVTLAALLCTTISQVKTSDGAAAPTSMYAPSVWYRFENASNIGIDSSAFGRSLTRGAVQDKAFWPAHQTKGGPVGGFLSFGSDVGAPAPFTKAHAWGAEICVPNADPEHRGACVERGLPQSPGITMEFLLRPNAGFMRGGIAEPLPGIEFGIQDMTWTVITRNPTDGKPREERTLKMSLGGAGVLAADYLWGAEGQGKYGGWHHIAASLDAKSGSMAFWIDGESQPTMRARVNTTEHVAAFELFSVDVRNAVALYGNLDEIAVFPMALPDGLIYQHFLDTLVHHRPYSLVDPGTVPPAPPNYPGPNSSDYYDMTEFPPGTELPSPVGDNNTGSVAMTCVDQLDLVAAPRFNLSSVAKYSTPYNFNWMDPHYMAGSSDVDPDIRLNNTNMTIALQHTLALKFRYGLLKQGLRVGTADKPWIPSVEDNLTFALANAHPELPLNTICPFGHIFRNQSKPDGCYLQNAHGQFIDVTGALVPPGGKKSIRPMSSKLAQDEGCPDSIWAEEGEAIRDFGFAPLAKYLTRPLNVVNLDGEVFVDVDKPAEDYHFTHDPKVVADFNSSGLPNWLTFWSAWRVRLTKAATDPYMTDPTLRAGVLKGTYLTMYQVQGTDNYFGNWSQTREIGSPMPCGMNHTLSMRYSTTDMYLESPHGWWQCSGSNHALCWVDNSRQSELQHGDTFFSPFMAAGWHGKAELNTRPPQWLGLLKIVAAWGAEWFYAGFFNVNEDSHGRMPPSSQWCWQGMMPSYAQATFTQVAPLVYEGALVFADANTTYAVKTNAKNYTYSPLLWAGQPNIIAVARRAGPVFLLTVAAQKNSNAALNLVHKNATAMVRVPGLTMDGVETMLTVTARLQGSVYVVRDDTEGAPVVYQIDTWHEATHPIYWPAATSEHGVSVEAELFSGHLSHLGATVMRTLRAPGTTNGDFRGSRTYVDLGVAAELGVAVEYPLREHGLTALADGGGTWCVRVLMMRNSVGSTLPAVNGVGLSPDASAETNTAQHTRGEGTSSAPEWVWYVAPGVLVDSSIVLTGVGSGAWVDRLQITSVDSF